MNYITIAVLVCLPILCIMFCLYGMKLGQIKERARVEGLLLNAFQLTGVGYVRWILNAVQSGKNDIMDLDKFFGKQNNIIK
jgi:hypothetical protein